MYHSLPKVSHFGLPKDTRWTAGVTSSLEVKGVEVKYLLGCCWRTRVGAGKLSDVTGIVKVADSDETEGVVEGAWIRVADGACGIFGSHSVVRVQVDWPEDCDDWGVIQVRNDGWLAGGCRWGCCCCCGSVPIREHLMNYSTWAVRELFVAVRDSHDMARTATHPPYRPDDRVPDEFMNSLRTVHDPVTKCCRDISNSRPDMVRSHDGFTHTSRQFTTSLHTDTTRVVPMRAS